MDTADNYLRIGWEEGGQIAGGIEYTANAVVEVCAVSGSLTMDTLVDQSVCDSKGA